MEDGIRTATVSLSVLAANDAPTATGESYGVQSGGPLTAQLAIAASSGTLVLNANGSFTFTPLSGSRAP